MMNSNEIVQAIFANDTNVEDKQDVFRDLRSIKQLNEVDNYIEENLSNLNNKTFIDSRTGCLGPAFVTLDLPSQVGYCAVSSDRLCVTAQSNYCSVRANTAFFGGKWMYEIQLESKGVMQLGWGSVKCVFNTQLGVGETTNSYSYDGNRSKKWNIAMQDYGETWYIGDIIGCAIDLDDGTVDFYRNGKYLDRAFSNISIGSGFAYFPAASLYSGESLKFNFGGAPYKYPMKDYQALQEQPTIKVLQANILFQWLKQLVKFLDYVKSTNMEHIQLKDMNMSVKTFTLCIARSILRQISSLLIVTYLIEAAFIPFFEELCNLNEEFKTRSDLDITNKKLFICLDLFWAFMDEVEIHMCLHNIVSHLFYAFKHIQTLMKNSYHYKSLILLTKLCEHTRTRQYLLQYILFNGTVFAHFLHIKPLDLLELTNVIPEVWWETTPLDPLIEKNKDSYLYTSEQLKDVLSDLEALQIQFLITLLNNTDGTKKTPTSRNIFLQKLKYSMKKNQISNYTHLPIALSCFHRLLVAFKILWDSEVGTNSIYMPCRAFCDASIDYSGIDRLGGVLSHLNRTFKNELLQLLGPDHDVIRTIEEPQDTSDTNSQPDVNLTEMSVVLPLTTPRIIISSSNQGSSIFLEIMGYFVHNTEDRTPIRYGPADSATYLMELLDAIIFFYQIIAKKQIAKVATVRNEMYDYIKAVTDINVSVTLMKNVNNPYVKTMQNDIVHALKVLNKKLAEKARQMAWVRAAIYSKEKQMQIVWLFKIIILTLQKASEQGNLLSFVPTFYLEALFDICLNLRSHMHPTVPIDGIEDYQNILLDVATFLSNHLLDKRIVHVDIKEHYVQTVGGFVSNSLTLKALENVPHEIKTKFVRNLFQSYSSKGWAQASWILVRFWQGNGFAFRYTQSPHLLKKLSLKPMTESIPELIKPEPSAVYQEHVKEVLLSDNEATLEFLNTILEHLNWAFSEFISMMQEIYMISLGANQKLIETRQLRVCATCFNLSVTLLRVVEMICAIAPSVFRDIERFSTKLLLSRLCQLLSHILNRLSSETNSMDCVIQLQIPDLEVIDRFPILTAVMGILVALLHEDMLVDRMNEVPKVTQILLREPNFQLSSLFFVIEQPNISSSTNKRKHFSILNYPDELTLEEVTKVKKLIMYLRVCHQTLPDVKTEVNDENVCTICYALPIAVTFKPCNHQTCRSCIDHHLFNTRKCFFCKVIIYKVENLDGEILHDFTDSISNRS